MSDERALLTARVLTLMDEGFRAQRAGDVEARDAAWRAALELDTFCVTAVRGGMMIGKVPNPDVDWGRWSAYVQAAREAADALD